MGSIYEHWNGTDVETEVSSVGSKNILICVSETLY